MCGHAGILSSLSSLKQLVGGKDDLVNTAFMLQAGHFIQNVTNKCTTKSAIGYPHGELGKAYLK